MEYVCKQPSLERNYNVPLLTLLMHVRNMHTLLPRWIIFNLAVLRLQYECVKNVIHIKGQRVCVCVYDHVQQAPSRQRFLFISLSSFFGNVFAKQCESVEWNYSNCTNIKSECDACEFVVWLLLMIKQYIHESKNILYSLIVCMMGKKFTSQSKNRILI